MPPSSSSAEQTYMAIYTCTQSSFLECQPRPTYVHMAVLDAYRQQVEDACRGVGGVLAAGKGIKTQRV